MDSHNISSNIDKNNNSNQSNMSLDGVQSGDSSLDHTDVRAELASAQPHASSSQGPAPPRPSRSAHQRQQQGQRLTRCRFFGSKKGCRAGDNCPYLHDDAPGTETSVQSDREIPGAENEQERSRSQIRDIIPAATTIGSSAASGSNQRGLDMARRHERVERPVTLAQKENPRNFQLNQLRRRFRPEETTIGDDTSLSFKLVPSDPDFPYELEALDCTMLIPSTYPEAGMPSIRVTNEEIGKELQANVEKAFYTLVDTDIKRKISGTLLGYMNAIDKQLEQLLSGRALQTFKFVGNVGLKNSDDSIPIKPVSRAPVSIPKVAPKPGDKFTSSEKSAAEARRREEIRQLEARLGRISLFSKSTDGTTFTVPLQPNKPERLPAPLRSVRSVKLLVPLLYPLEKCEIEIPGVSRADARSTESAFGIWSASKKEANLSARINYLAHNMHIMANRPVPPEEKIAPITKAPSPPAETQAEVAIPAQTSTFDEDVLDRPHVQVVPRPPEWSMPNVQGDSDDSDDYDSEIDDSEDEDDEDGGIGIPDLPEPACQILLSLPFVELYGIELLEVRSLHVTVKCDRCKEVMDVKNVKAGDGDETGPVKVESCKKCASYMSIGFRKQFVHPNSNHAGYLEMDGCVVVDMLPSNFIPTCSECSTVYPTPGVISVRGETVSTTCRECHRKMRFKLPEVKFLTVSRAAVKTHRFLPRKPKESLGIVAGQELPRRGRCAHYGKSYRWFRFSCCSKVFPCDKCHDSSTDHPNEHANRMICGLCSREQNYRPEDCGHCHAILVGKAGSGFWEGGKGTRDKARMSRKDPRKYKRRGGTVVGSGGTKRK